MRAHVYILCVLTLTAQSLLQLSIVLFQRQLFHMTIDLQKTWQVSYKFEDILQQISDERWCASDDDCLDNERDENLDDFSRLEDPLDKAGAGNKEDDEDDETSA